MPEIEAYADIDPDEFWSCCSSREKKELIDDIVGDATGNDTIKEKLIESISNHFPEESTRILTGIGKSRISIIEEEFYTSLRILANSYLVLSAEQISSINSLAKKYG